VHSTGNAQFSKKKGIIIAYFYTHIITTEKYIMQLKKHFSVVAIVFACSFIFSAKLSAQTAAGDSLAMFRVQIDSLDKQLIQLLGKRMQVVEQVGQYKALHNIPALQKARFDAILQKNITMGKAYGLSETLVTEVMNAIHKESLGKEGAVGAPGEKKE
jgi:chorismate mutase